MKINIKQYKKIYKEGFSLLELLVVILILGILAGLVVPKLIGKGEEAKRDLVCVQMQSLKSTFSMFKMDNGVYPDTEEGFMALNKNPDAEKYPNYSSSGYLEKTPKDSWGKNMQYIKKESMYEIISYGSDRKEGGTEDASDIYFSKCKGN